ncbi:MAG: rhomboid family intramembrane serine protease [Gammaproteobacteria bacterium]|nr:rhomboid family intramembrane serine protease [Gammaproteobacteria bacterium]MDH3749082.1 rhomboid family intramembrane serine protease [Gammaproteobacteria bacterium]
MRVVFESRNRRACSDRALVLASLQIPYEMVEDIAGCALIVPAEFSAQAMDELRLYDQENPPRRPRKVRTFAHQNALPGVIAYIILISAVAWLAGLSYFGQDWLGAGRIDGALIRAGEWWRTVTALTLHAGLRHLIGNIVFGAFFGLFAGRLLGPGIAWLAIVLAGASGNALNTLLLESSHRSIGASTAVFAALGLLAGFVWRAKLMSQERWPYRVGPIVGGFALLMYTGTGDANTDIGAHLMGFLCGMAGGMLLTLVRDQLTQRRWQIAGAVSAFGIVVAAWLTAFQA